jgi:hypothetical protein
MALVGTDHWRRALAVTSIVVFVFALMGGLLAVVIASGESLAVAANTAGHGHGHVHVHTDVHAEAAAESSTNGSGSSSGTKLTAAVKAHVDQALLQSSDFPTGWTPTGAVSTSRTSPWSKTLATCADVPSSIAAIKPTKVSGTEYTSPDKTMAAEDSISVYPTAAEGRAVWQHLASAKTPTCMNRIGSAALRASVQQEAGSGATVGTVTIAALAPGTYEAGQTGYTVTIPLVSDGRQLTIISTEITFVHGRYVHQVTFNGNGVQFTPLLQVHLVRQVEART